MISVSKPTWWITRGVWPVKTFGFTQIKKGIGSTRQGIVESYTTSFNRKYHQLENRAWLRKQRIQFTKSIMYPRKGSQGYWIRRTLSNNNPIKDLTVHNGADVSIGTQPVEERMQGHQILEHLNDTMLRYQRNYDFEKEWLEVDALIKGG